MTLRMLELVSRSPSDTLAIGRRLAAMLQAGDVILLAGRLGSGKTLLASGIAEGLGVSDPVTSPSFVIVRSYLGFLPVYHADVYRLGSMGELDDLQLIEQAGDGVLLVEWGDAVEGSLPADHLLVHMSIEADESRVIRLTGKGAWAGRSLEELDP